MTETRDAATGGTTGGGAGGGAVGGAVGGDRPDAVLGAGGAVSIDAGADAAGGRPTGGAGAGHGGASGAGGHAGQGSIGAPFAVARFVSPFAPDALTQLVDVNGDKAPELVSAVGDNLVVSFFERGAFRANVTSAIGSVSGSASPSMGDLNGDGRPDAIVTGAEDGLDHILLGRGDGSFTATSATVLVTSESGSGTDIAISDLNRDGFGDLVAPVPSIGPIFEFTVRLGKGDGTFGAATKYPSNTFAWPPIFADINGADGLDLIIGDTFFLNNGGGRFGPQTRVPDAWIFCAADLNGDGLPDLVARPLSNPADGLRIFFNQRGTFGTPVTYLTGRMVTRVEVADLDGDMRPDLVVGTGSPDELAFSPEDGLFILLNRASGFANPVRYLPGTFGYSWADSREWLVVGDLNGDGRPDIVTDRGTVEYALAREVKVLFNLGNGSFADAITLSGTGRAMAIVDVDRDGDGDIMAEQGTVVFANGDDNARFAQLSMVPLADGPRSLRLLDLDGDGALDILFRGGEALGSIRGHGDGTLDQVVIIAERLGSAKIGVADMNGDGAPDIAVALGGSSGGLDILMNDGRGRFATHATFATPPYADAVAVADFDGDGDVDIATPAVGGVSVFMNDGAARFASHVEYNLGTTPRALTAMDVDGDGRPDLVLDVNEGLYQVIRNRGAGNLAPDALVEFVGRTLAWADLTGDGLPEHIVGSPSPDLSSEFTIFSNSAGTFGPGALGEAPGLVLPIADVVAGDVNGDGRSDLVAVNQLFADDRYVALLMGNGAGRFSVGDIYSIIGYAFALGDMTGDGHLDLVVGYEDRVRVFANTNKER